MQAITKTALEATLKPADKPDILSFNTKELRQQLENAESVRAATKRALDGVFKKFGQEEVLREIAGA